MLPQRYDLFFCILYFLNSKVRQKKVKKPFANDWDLPEELPGLSYHLFAYVLPQVLNLEQLLLSEIFLNEGARMFINGTRH
jgi:hypothetical protein